MRLLLAPVARRTAYQPACLHSSDNPPTHVKMYYAHETTPERIKPTGRPMSLDHGATRPTKTMADTPTPLAHSHEHGFRCGGEMREMQLDVQHVYVHVRWPMMIL